MKKEVISDKQGIYIVIMFILGTATVIIRGIEAKQDLWIAILLALSMGLIVSFICIRLHNIFPNKDLFDIIEICFGEFIGKIIGLLYVWFTFHLSYLIVSDFGYFTTTVTLINTPIILINTIAVILGIYAVKEGLEVISRWIKFFLPLLLGLLLFISILSFPSIDINNARPVLSQGVKPIVLGAFSAFSFPFGEIIIFTMVFDNFQNEKSPRKIYFRGLLISGIILLLLWTVYLLVLGANTASKAYFPAHIVTSRISLRNKTQRIEGVLETINILATFAKLCISLLATCRGMSKIFKFTDYRFLVTPIAFMIINLSYPKDYSIMEWLEWDIEVWPYFSLPFELILPIIILIIAEIKNNRLVTN